MQAHIIMVQYNGMDSLACSAEEFFFNARMQPKDGKMVWYREADTLRINLIQKVDDSRQRCKCMVRLGFISFH